ncbi:MAG: phosphoribosylglycinamide formyltransferase [Planctomycetes bacterium]|nr:phosphoribosylglycinamide formyltransferase [Planctomycetota bacterium]
MAEEFPVAVLLSGDGTTLQNLLDLHDGGELDIDVRLVISSRRDAYGLQRAHNHGIATLVLPRGRFDSVADYTRAVFDPVRDAGARLVILAGFMVQIGVPKDFRHRILNVHPALIPAFCGKGMYGHFVHEAVLESGVKITGCTVHFVDDEYDHGPIVLQSAVPVLDDDTPDTLAERVQAEERRIYPEAVRLFIEDRLKITGNRVRGVDGPSAETPQPQSKGE